MGVLLTTTGLLCRRGTGGEGVVVVVVVVVVVAVVIVVVVVVVVVPSESLLSAPSLLLPHSRYPPLLLPDPSSRSDGQRTVSPRQEIRQSSAELRLYHGPPISMGPLLTDRDVLPGQAYEL